MWHKKPPCTKEKQVNLTFQYLLLPMILHIIVILKENTQICAQGLQKLDYLINLRLMFFQNAFITIVSL